MEHWWNVRQGKTGLLGQKPVPVPLVPLRISCALAWDLSLFFGLRGRRITDCAMARPPDNAKQSALEVFCSLPG